MNLCESMSYCIWWGMNLDSFFRGASRISSTVWSACGTATWQCGCWKPLKIYRNLRDVRLGFLEDYDTAREVCTDVERATHSSQQNQFNSVCCTILHAWSRNHEGSPFPWECQLFTIWGTCGKRRENRTSREVERGERVGIHDVDVCRSVQIIVFRCIELV